MFCTTLINSIVYDDGGLWEAQTDWSVIGNTTVTLDLESNICIHVIE